MRVLTDESYYAEALQDETRYNVFVEYKLILGIAAVGIEILAYGIYFWSIYKGDTKPHAFTWFVWGVLGAVSFAAVLVSGGEAGAWVLGVNALFGFIIAGIGVYQKHVEYDLLDWLALLGALLGIYLWWLTSNALYAVILVSISDALAFGMTMRKAYRSPFQENASSYGVGIIYYILSIFALGSLTLTTFLYPLVIIILDLVLVGIIVVRRKSVKTESAANH